MATQPDSLTHERESLIRLCPRMEVRQDEDSRPTLVGYAAVFNEWTTIDSWEGRFREQLHPKAFNRTLKEDRDSIQILFNHGMDPQIGDKPLGRAQVLRADDTGLYVEVPLDDTSYNRDIEALLRSGALRGMSFRMTVQDESWDYPEDGLPERTIRGVRLHEAGPVTFPAYKATQAGVRAHAPEAYVVFRSASNVGDELNPEGQAETTPEEEDEGQAETTPEPDAGPEQDPPRSRDPKIRELELMRMRTVAANRALRLVRSQQ